MKKNILQNNRLISFSILILFSIAIFLRLYQLDKLPPSIFIDEYNLFSDALKIVLHEPHPAWYGIGWYGTPQLSIVIYSWFIKFFGTGWLSFKLAWGIPAILLLPIIYKLAKTLFNRPTAILTFLVLAVSPMHIHLSRWAHGAIIVTTTNSISALFWYLGITKNKLYLTALSALFFVLSLYIYVGARSFGVFFILGFVQLWWISIKKHQLKVALKHSLVFNLVLVISIYPNLNYGRTHLTEMWGRTQELSIVRSEFTRAENLERIKHNLQLYTEMLVGVRPDPNLRHDPLQKDVLPFPLFWLSLLGLLCLLWQKKRRQAYFVLSLFVASMVGGLLSIEAPSIFRTNLVLVPVSILASYAIFIIWQILARTTKNTVISRILLVILTSLFLSGSIIQSQKYFALAAKPTKSLLEAFTSFETRIADQTVTELEMNKSVYLSPDYYWFAATQYQARSRQKSDQIHLFEPTQDVKTWSGASLILDPAYASIIDYLTLIYPDLQLQTITTLVGRKFLLVRVPPVDPISDQNMGLSRICRTTADQPESTQIDPTIFVGWGDQKPSADDVFTCSWNGWLRPPKSGNYTFSISADDGISFNLTDGSQSVLTLSSATSNQEVVSLNAKSYRVKADYQNNGGAAGAYVYVRSEQNTEPMALSPLWLKP